MSKPRVIAFYLPQFHPIPENDVWWGKGFTEWTNVGKAKPLFWGHKQPKVPTELGYYDLRLPDVRNKQVQLAKEAGVEGFCYWHYYFGDGKQLIEKPLQEVLVSGEPDFPFCLGWANESWEKKQWNKDGSGNKVLIEQKYNGKEDYKKHFEIVLPMFKDSRYIRVDGKPVFLIYKPYNIPNCKEFIDYWNELAIKELGCEIFFIAHAVGNEPSFDEYYEMNFSGVYSNRIYLGAIGKQDNVFVTIKNILLKLLHMPRLINFNYIVQKAAKESDNKDTVYPGIMCGWDHTPRSGKKGRVIINFKKENFKEHIKAAFELVSNRRDQNKIVFLKSWNEWGEGNFMEPDLEYGKQKIDALREVMEEQC